MDYSLKEELKHIWRRRKWVLSFSILSALISAILCSPIFISDEYYASVELIAPDLSNVKMLTIAGNSYTGVSVGGDADMERILSVLTSIDCKRKLINQFDLYKRYDIQEDEPSKRGELIDKEFRKHFAVTVSNNSTIRIETYDTDPVMSAKMANWHIAYTDTFLEEIARRKEGLIIIQNIIKELEIKQEQLEDTLSFLRSQHSLFHVAQLSEFISQDVGKNLTKDLQFKLLYDKFIRLEKTFHLTVDQLAKYRLDETFLKKHLETYPSLLTVASYAMPADFKIRPQRLSIVLTSTLAALFFVSILIVIFDK